MNTTGAKLFSFALKLTAVGAFSSYPFVFCGAGQLLPVADRIATDSSHVAIK